MRKRLAIIGGKGNGTVIAAAAEADGWQVLGFLSDGPAPDIEIAGHAFLDWVGHAREWFERHDEVYLAFALQKVGVSHKRFAVLANMALPLQAFAAIQHPTAVVPRDVRLGHGVIFMPGAVVSPGARLGDLTQMYANSFVGHDTAVADRVFISNNASVGGACQIKTGVHVGSNATIREGVHVGEWAVIGAGAVVLRDVKAYEVVVGNPARHLRFIEP